MTDMSDIVQEAHERQKRAEEWESSARKAWLDDVRFVNADSYNRNQWPDNVWKARNPAGEAGRPCLTINRAAQHCLQITNEARQSQMGVKVNAVGFGATSEAADALEGIIRHIEYQSNAQQNAYAMATMHQVQGGIGWVHITTDYIPSVDTFDQDLFIKAIQDPMTVFSDPDCQEPDHSDMRWAGIVEELPREVFKAQYPDHAEIGQLAPIEGAGSEWRTKDNVRVMRYYRLAESDDTLWLVPDAPANGDKPAIAGGPIRQSKMPADMLDMAREEKWRSRPIQERTVEWYLIAGDEVIEHGDTVFDHVPLVPWIGIETVIEDRLDRKGHARALLDPQRMYNYFASSLVEQVALQTKVPWLVDMRAIEGHEAYWKAANISNLPYLPYRGQDPDNGTSPIQMPQRIEPPAFSQAHTMGMSTADQQMQVVSGQYQAEMGAPGNEKSGVAIQQRQRQSDTATYHFTDNQGAALRLIGRILIGAIPKVYDTQRAVQVLAMDGSRSGVAIDPSIGPAHQTVEDPDGQQEAILVVNPMVGRYDVEADVGASFATRRQEAFNAIVQVLQSAPALTEKVGDLLFKCADFPMADQLAKRLAPPGDDPKTAALQQQLTQATQALHQLQQKLQAEQNSNDADVLRAHADMTGAQQKTGAEATKAANDRYKAETDRMAAIGSIDPEMFKPILRQLVAEAMGGAHWSQTPLASDGAQAGPPQGMPPGQPVPSGSSMGQQGASGQPDPGQPGPGTPTGLDLQRMPTMNPPGGAIQSAVPTNGAVQ